MPRSKTLASRAPTGGSATLGQPADQPAVTSTQQAESAPAGGIEVFEHDVLTVPADPGFRKNPFVDGAIVRFFPEENLAARTCAVLIAPPPPRPIDKAMADPSLLAHMFVDKHDRHMPYYRQEAELERFGWPVPRSNMTRWQHECGNLVRPLVDAMWEQALPRSWFAMDAKGTAIRGSPEYKRGHIFVLIAEAESELFRFSPTYDAKNRGRRCGSVGLAPRSCRTPRNPNCVPRHPLGTPNLRAPLRGNHAGANTANSRLTTSSIAARRVSNDGSVEDSTNRRQPACSRDGRRA